MTIIAQNNSRYIAQVKPTQLCSI